MTYPTDRRVLSLDLATQCGWALLANGVLTSGSEGFHRYSGCKSKPAEHVGQSFLNFQRWLRERIATDKPAEIVFEEPFGHLKSAQARNILVGFRGVLMVNAAYYDLPVSGYVNSAVKRYATGRGVAEKAAMVAWARGIVGRCRDDNEADALAVLHLHLSTVQSGQS